MAMYKKRIKSAHAKVTIWPMTMLSLGLAAPVLAQNSGQSGAVVEEIIVSARRQEESSQEIPISITVVDQETLSNNNVFSAADLKQFTPSLSINNRFGPDQASFAIRGFTQELRTTASVGVYFAEVVAPRGGGSVTAGDGAGPGAFFDLQNVLVLKGPQGTLFGRNTTGGAILLTPQEPTNQLEGYLEGSAGDYDMQRIQGVINVPLGDRVRTRFGVDTMQRDGYVENTSGVGPSELADVDYISGRASVMVDVTDSVENYTIFSYTNSENTGMASSLFACGGGIYGDPQCSEQLAQQGDDFYTVQSLSVDPVSELKQWQIINTTTWAINDDLTLKNILSYADLKQNTRSAVYGINYRYADLGYYGFTEADTAPGYDVNSQISFVEEIQLQGYAMDGDLTWQAGLYFENSRPDGTSGSQSRSQLFCSSYDRNNLGNSQCVDVQRNALYNTPDVGGGVPGWIAAALSGPLGGINRQLGEVEFINQAVYSEATYQINDEWRVTGGLRYTKDRTNGEVVDSRVWGPFPFGGYTAPVIDVTGDGIPDVGLPTELGQTVQPSTAAGEQCVFGDPNPAVNGCKDSIDQTSEAVTGLLDVDYFLSQDVMLYAKYARGYRQGSVSIFGGEGFRKFNPEHVDAYEIGAKTTFGGIIPGTFNISAFYNDLKDQQIQIGYVQNAMPPNTGIDNAGASVIQGVEVESSLMLLDDLIFNLSYTYLDTMLKELTEPEPIPGVRLIPSSIANEHLTFSPRHSIVASLNYRLPLPVEIGDISIGGTYSYTAEQLSSAPEYINNEGRLSGSPYAWLPSYEVVNFTVNWMSIFGSSFDGSLFVSNAFDEEYPTYISGVYNSLGMETRMVGAPRMWGARVRYTFGQ